MPDLTFPELERHLINPVLAPTRLPYSTRAGDTVSVCNGVIYLNARPLRPVDALDLSIALARAVNETDHTNQQEASHG